MVGWGIIFLLPKPLRWVGLGGFEACVCGIDIVESGSRVWNVTIEGVECLLG